MWRSRSSEERCGFHHPRFRVQHNDCMSCATSVASAPCILLLASRQPRSPDTQTDYTISDSLGPSTKRTIRRIGPMLFLLVLKWRFGPRLAHFTIGPTPDTPPSGHQPLLRPIPFHLASQSQDQQQRPRGRDSICSICNSAPERSGGSARLVRQTSVASSTNRDKGNIRLRQLLGDYCHS
jgi:hypothetical protein